MWERLLGPIGIPLAAVWRRQKAWELLIKELCAEIERLKAENERLAAWGLGLQRSENAAAKKMQQMAESESNRALRTELDRTKAAAAADLESIVRKWLQENPSALGTAVQALTLANEELQAEVERLRELETVLREGARGMATEAAGGGGGHASP